jgi:hypothetical protein
MSVESSAVSDIQSRFLALTGLSSVEVAEEQAGLEQFLRFVVGRDAPMYRRALSMIDAELGDAHPYHGRLSLDVQKSSDIIQSKELELLRTAITSSLRVTTERLGSPQTVQFLPFRGGEEHRVTQPANHAILGRRGVGKSSLILMAHERVKANGHLPVWLDLQPYHKRGDHRAVLEVLRELIRDLGHLHREYASNKATGSLNRAIEEIDREMGKRSSTTLPDSIRALIPGLRSLMKEYTRETGKQVFVFLDDAHVIAGALQPFLFDCVASMLKGAGGWLKVAGVKNLLRLYEPATKTGLQPPHDVQLVQLDLTLVDPGAAREHLTSILSQFLSACGFKHSGTIIHDRAIDRLVWCSAGVPRDFLWLLERGIAFAVQHRRRKVGVQEVNLSVGEFGQAKMSELNEDVTDDGEFLRSNLERLQSIVLDQNKANSFLIRLDPNHPGYQAIQKLADLRLVHLIHPSITPGKAGKRFEAYLLDYSFYTGMRRRHGLSELQIHADEPPRYAELRRLPKVDLNIIVGEAC